MTDSPAKPVGRRWHQIFEFSLALKGLLALVELIAGLALYLEGSFKVALAVTWLVVHELTEDPTDMLGSALRRVAESLSLDTHDFFAIYLGAHGLIKLFIIVSLARGLRWAFPTGIVVLGAFVLYQSYHFVIGPSVILFAITSFDMFVIALIWREYRAMPKLDEVAA